MRCPKCNGRLFYDPIVGKPYVEPFCMCGWHGREVPLAAVRAAKAK